MGRRMGRGSKAKNRRAKQITVKQVASSWDVYRLSPIIYRLSPGTNRLRSTENGGNVAAVTVRSEREKQIARATEKISERKIK